MISGRLRLSAWRAIGDAEKGVEHGEGQAGEHAELEVADLQVVLDRLGR